jgi:hypothetical protein
MVSPAYYREQARLLKEWATQVDAATAVKLMKRAVDYEALAQLLDDCPDTSPPIAPLGQPVAQQQQQVQPKDDDTKE